MTNPWKTLKNDARFVLADDWPYIDAYNALHKGSESFINLLYPPEPRLGPVNAPVIILQLNPSYPRDESEGPKDQVRLTFDLKSIKDESHAHLGVVLGDRWWTPRLRKLIENVGAQRLGSAICSIDFFPYRSRRFDHGQIRLPSQSYTFSLVRNGLDRGATFIVTRNFKLWSAAIPELRSQLGQSVFCLKNPRSSYFTPENLPRGVFAKVLRRLRDSS